jgi:hypothetical protein
MLKMIALFFDAESTAGLFDQTPGQIHKKIVM